MDGIQGGRGNKDSCVVGGLNPRMILGFNTSASGRDNLIVKQNRHDRGENRRVWDEDPIYERFRGSNGVRALQVGQDSLITREGTARWEAENEETGMWVLKPNCSKVSHVLKKCTPPQTASLLIWSACNGVPRHRSLMTATNETVRIKASAHDPADPCAILIHVHSSVQS